MINEIQKRTNGQVQISFHSGGSLVAAANMYQGVVNGIADIGHSNTGYTSGQFPITGIVENSCRYPGGWV